MYFEMSCAVFTALGVVALSLVAVLWRKCAGGGCSVFSAVHQYMYIRWVTWVGRRQRQQLEKDTLNVRTAQETTLLKHLRSSKDTLYGQKYQFSSITDSKDFREHHPITTCDHYEKLIQQVAAGEKKVLVTETPLLTMTSGSSGSSKMLLNTKEINKEYFSQGVSVCADVLTKAFPNMPRFLKTFRLCYPHAERYSDAGVRIGATRSSAGLMFHMYTSPAPVFQVRNETSALYLQLLFALKEKNVGTVECTFCSALFDAFRFLEVRWEELVDDIQVGRISSGLDLDVRIISALEKSIKPDRIRAAELRAGFDEGFEGIAVRLWPRLHLIQSVDSGPSQIYGENLRQNYCRGVQFYSPVYTAAEGLIGVNLWPLQETRRYLLCPRSMFLEFLPEENLNTLDTQHTPNTLLMDEVEEGKSYELIITSAAGLFRYRIGDVMKVVGFYNQCAVVEFLYRCGQMLNVRGEKVNESVFLGALNKAVTQWAGAKLVDYCCAESGILGDSSGGAQPHYQVFLELTGVRNLTEDQRYKLDVCLQTDCTIYRSFRIKGSIGPMRVHLVKRGAFRELKSHMTSLFSTSLNTFQMPRVIRGREFADFLLRRTVS
ncbi:GH3 domain-containing protein [Trichomycterus rosablanca]|uniref:GH3 domain-containing protein n=1 Tax=Trichomycterus rosablanca TaxID=2290929 RepID=UPI002F359350